MLTWRRAVPCLAVLTVLPFLVPTVVGQALLSLSMLPPAYLALRARRRAPRGSRMLLCIAAGFVVSSLGAVDILVNGGRASLVSIVLSPVSGALFFAATLFLSYARRPSATREGIVDGFAALAGIVVMKWQWSALQPGATTYSLAAGAAPVVTLFLLLTIVIVYSGVARDRRQDRRILLALMSGSTLMVVGVAVTEGFTSWRNGPIAVACYLVAGYLTSAYFSSPNLPRVVEQVPDGPTLFSMRWLGPAFALATTPLMILLFVWQRAIPTVAVGVACSAMTALALWRVTRLSHERERSRRELLAEQRFRGLVEHAADVVVTADAGLRITYANGGASELLGGGDVVGAPVAQLFDTTGGEHLAMVIAALPGEGDGARLPVDVFLRRTSGEARWVSVHVTNRLSSPTIAGWVLNIHDVTDRKRAEESLALLAHYDQLTGLPNRPALARRIEASVTAMSGRTALLFCDLDGFKVVNDGLGHDSGDEVLQAVAGRWSALLRAGDVLGRWGGDEFVMVCPGVETVADVERVARRLTDALVEPFALRAGPATLGVSIGAVIHQEGESAEELIRRADTAMYEAKRARAGVRLG